MSKQSARIAALKRTANRTGNFAGRHYVARNGQLKDLVVEARRQLAELGLTTDPEESADQGGNR
jgi:hypothetical protein